MSLNQTVPEALGSWLATTKNGYFATLTPRREVSHGAFERIVDEFMRDTIRKRWLIHARVCRAMDYARSVHAHLLIDILDRNPDIQVAAQFERDWHRTPVGGAADVKRYDPSRGAPYYVADHPQWDVTMYCPRPPACRRAGKKCVYLRA